jgi:rhodanese-related sulfurtransferase
LLLLRLHFQPIIDMDITVQELKQKLDEGTPFVFIDVREPWEYEEFNLGAKLIPLGELSTRQWELEDHKGDEIVVHCRSGARSAAAQAMLQAQGFSNVRNLTGGVLAWQTLIV